MQCKNPLFARQKPYFCTAKTILLFFVSITSTLLICYEYSVKWLRTFHKMPNQRSVKCPHSPTKCPRTTPPGIGTDSSCPYPCIIKYTYSFHRIHVSTLSNMRFRSPFLGCFHICGHDKSAPTAANGLPKCCKQYAYNATFNHETPNQHSVKYPHSPTKCPRTTPPGVGADSSCPYPCITKYTYSFHQICISVSSYTNIHIIKYAFPFPISWVFTYMRAR